MIYTYYRQLGNKILLRYIDEEGETHSKKIDFYKPKLYLRSEKECSHRSIYGEPLREVEFPDINAAKQFAEEHKYIPEIGLNGNSNYANQFIIEVFDGKTPKFDINTFNIGMFDIEVDADEFPLPEEAKYVVNAFSLYSSKENKFYSRAIPHKPEDNWSKDASEEEEIKKLDIDFKLCQDETELLMEFLTLISSGDYHIISGWNSQGFDVPYLVNRCSKIVGEKTTRKMLSPFNKIDERESIDNYGKKKVKYILSGLPHLDFMDLYKKHVFTPRESYKLDFIASEELGENKIEYEDTLHDLYRENFQKFVDYNIQDSNLIKRLDDKLGLFQLTLSLAYISLSNFEDTMGTVKIWEQLVAKFLYQKGNKVPLFRKEAITDERDFEGAFVKEPVPGFYNWIVSFDLNSLYPHIEQQWNIGPETLVPYDQLPSELKEIVDNYTFNDILDMKVNIKPLLEKHNLTMAANFEFYKIDEMSFFSEIKRELYSERKVHKKAMLGYEQKKVDAENELRRRGIKF